MNYEKLSGCSNDVLDVNSKEETVEIEYLSKLLHEIKDISLQSIVRSIIFYDKTRLKDIPIMSIIKKYRPESKK